MNNMNGKYVLIIEDNAFINSAYGTKFNRENIPYKIAVDGEEALKKLRDESALLPAVIILDIILPRKNGFEVLSSIKNDSRTKMIPVVVLTNLSQEIERRRAMDLGASEYLVKADTKIDSLADKVRKYMAY